MRAVQCVGSFLWGSSRHYCVQRSLQSEPVSPLQAPCFPAMAVSGAACVGSSEVWLKKLVNGSCAASSDSSTGV